MIRTLKIYSLSNFQIYNTVFLTMGLPGGSDGKEYACNVADPGSIPGLGRHPGEGNAYPLPHSCLENSMDRKPGRYSPFGHMSDMTATNFFTFFFIVNCSHHARQYPQDLFSL